ncbi:MAG: hypothetical protein M1281_17415, partial [Chloroflexi bacterium]|nr:hypothetical protein [Chloroflexota bacterium]
MDTLDNEPSLREMHAPSDFLWNTVTILILIAILGTSVMFLIVYTDHHMGMNLLSSGANAPTDLPQAAAAPAIASTPTRAASTPPPATPTPLPVADTQTPTAEPSEPPILITPEFNL